jgi:hypothetical protein
MPSGMRTSRVGSALVAEHFDWHHLDLKAAGRAVDDWLVELRGVSFNERQEFIHDALGDMVGLAPLMLEDLGLGKEPLQPRRFWAIDVRNTWQCPTHAFPVVGTPVLIQMTESGRPTVETLFHGPVGRLADRKGRKVPATLLARLIGRTGRVTGVMLDHIEFRLDPPQ